MATQSLLPTCLTSELWTNITPMQRDMMIFTELSESYLPMTEEWDKAYTRLVNKLLHADALERSVAKDWLDSHIDPLETLRVRRRKVRAK